MSAETGSLVAPFAAVARFALHSPLNLLGSVIGVVVLVCSLFGIAALTFDFVWTPYDPLKLSLANRLQPPSLENPFGTDKTGRDMLSRVLAGAYISFSITLAVLAMAATLGTAVGIVAGYAGGWVDEALMRLTDMFLAFPALILAAAISATFGGTLTTTTLALGVVFWPWYARLVRSRVLSIKTEDFVTAYRCLGASHGRVMTRCILPVVLPLVVVQATTDAGLVMLSAAGLSFLGLGAQPPTPEWGSMIFSAMTHQPEHWWLAAFPGLGLALTALAFTLIGDGLRDMLDPDSQAAIEE